MGVYASFAFLIFLWMLPGVASGHGLELGQALAGSFLSFLGPFAGILVHEGGGSCSACGSFLRATLPFCAAGLALGVAPQFVPLEALGLANKLSRVIRAAVCLLGLSGWFGGAFLSMLMVAS